MQNLAIIKSSFGYVVDFKIESPDGEALLNQAIELFKRHPFPSISTVQRELNPGYAIAAQIVDELQRRGIVSEIQTDGTRKYFGEGAAGKAAFIAFAAEIRAGTESAAHWWRNLGATERRKYLPGGEASQWGDLSGADKAKLRTRYHLNLQNLRNLENQFSYRKGAGASA